MFYSTIKIFGGGMKMPNAISSNFRVFLDKMGVTSVGGGVIQLKMGW